MDSQQCMSSAPITDSVAVDTYMIASDSSSVRKMILVADKSEHSRYRLARILEKEGHRVLVASDANEAKATAAVVSIDLLLADLDLPGVAGGELMRDISASAGGKPP